MTVLMNMNSNKGRRSIVVPLTVKDARDFLDHKKEYISQGLQIIASKYSMTEYTLKRYGYNSITFKVAPAGHFQEWAEDVKKRRAASTNGIQSWKEKNGKG